MLRRTKAIISDLLPKKDDNIVFCQLSELQLRAYKCVRPSLAASASSFHICLLEGGCTLSSACHGIEQGCHGQLQLLI